MEESRTTNMMTPSTPSPQRPTVPQVPPFQLMQQALDSLELSVIHEYRQALDACPHLVYHETPFLPFLRTDKGDHTAAARRLALYWKYRKLLFGADRWLLPMTQTGSGALDARDIALLRSGYQVFSKRPPPAGPVLIDDWSRLPVHPDTSEIRIAMYFITVYAADHECGLQDPGITCIHVVSSRQRPVVSTNPLIWQVVHTALPMRLQQFIVAQAYEGVGWELLLEYKAFETRRAMEFKAHQCLHTNVLVGHSQQETLQLLEARAASRSYLPRESFGGDYDYSQFDDWTRMRLSLEDILSAAPPVANASLAATVSSPVIVTTNGDSDSVALVVATTKTTTTTVATQAQQQQTRTPLTAEQKRQRQNGYFRKHQAKRYAEVVQMQERRRELAVRNEALRRDNQRLEAFMASALQLIETTTTAAETVVIPEMNEEENVEQESSPFGDL